MNSKIKNTNKEVYYKILKLILIAIIIMVFILAVLMSSYRYYRNLLIQSEQNNILNLVTTVSSQLELYFNERDKYVKEIINEPDFQQEFMNLIKGKTVDMIHLNIIHRLQRDEYKALELIDGDGKLLKVYTDDPMYKYIRGEDIKRAIKKKKDVYFVQTTEDQSINVVHFIKINGEIKGFIRMKMNTNYIYDTYLKKYKLNQKGYISVKDKYGRILLHPSNTCIGQDVVKARKKQYPNYDWSELEYIVKRQVKKETGVGIYHSIWPSENTRVKKISGFVPCKIGDTFIIINFSIDYKETISTLKKFTNTILLISIILVITFFIIIGYIYTVEIKKNKLTIESIYNQQLKEKHGLLMHQSKFAAMGEMLATIAHQLKQPLNALKISLYNVEDYHKFKENNENYLYTLLESNHKFIDKMAKTIDDFKFFFKPQDKNMKFNIYKAIIFAIDLNVARINNLEININVQGNKNLAIRGESNIFSQVILNLLNNSIDALKIINDNRLINIFIIDKKKDIIIELMDNGGGISDEILDKIYEPYVTTKGDNGTGLGLYISKIILKEKYGGDLTIENTKVGVLNRIILPKGGETKDERSFA